MAKKDLNNIICPDCGCEIPINEALSHQLEAEFKKDYEQKLKSLQETEEKLKKEKANVEEEFSKKLKLSLEEKEKELTEKSRQYLLEQKDKLKQDATKEIQDRFSLELEDLKRQNQEKEQKIKNAQEIELKLREERRQLEEKEKNLEIEMIRKIDEERGKLSLKIEEEFAQKQKMEKMEFEKKLQDMQKALEDAQRRGNASSERFRGEILELELEESLKSNFIYDEIKEVPKGILGADVSQVVKDSFGGVCGTILWESKRTKAFNEEWITKLKDDLIRSKANCAILVTQTLPDEIKTFAFRNGVWVCGFSHYLELSMVLRLNLIELKRYEKINEGKDTKMSQVYNYLGSDDFKNKIQSVTETFIEMRGQIEQEKRAFQKQWATREMQIKRMTEGTISIVGDLQGLMGGSLPRIEGLDIPGLGFDV